MHKLHVAGERHMKHASAAHVWGDTSSSIYQRGKFRRKRSSALLIHSQSVANAGSVIDPGLDPGLETCYGYWVRSGKAHADTVGSKYLLSAHLFLSIDVV